MEMASEKLLSTSKIIWCDPLVNSKENRGYIKALTDLKYSLDSFQSSEDTANFLKANPIRKYIIITAGSTGHDLLKRVESLSNVIGVIVFCFDKAKHLKWAKDYQMVKSVTTSIAEVIEEVKKISQNFLLLGALESAAGSDYEVAKEILNGSVALNGTDVTEYFHFKTEKVMDFKLTSILLKVTPTPSEVLEELLAFKSDENCEKEIRSIFQGYEQQSFNLLRTFCYLYSTNLIYSQFTRACASKSYMKVTKTIKATLNKLRDQPARIFKENTQLFRGVKKAMIKLEEYRDKKGFWPSFTSTSQNEAIAKHFAGPQGVIFVISLSKQSTHPNVIIDEGWSKYPIEKEVLLFPYFSLQTTSITEKDGYTYIHVKQNEQDSVLSLENDDYWPLNIELGIYIGLEEKFYQIYEDFCTTLTIENIVGNKKFALSVLEVAVNEINQANSGPERFSNLLLKLTNQSEDIYSNLQERVSNRLRDAIPDIIKGLLEENIKSIYEQTNSQIDKIVAEEALGSQEIHAQINERIFKGLTEVFNSWMTLEKEITLKGMLNPLSSVLADEIMNGITAGKLIELESMEDIVSVLSGNLKWDKIKMKPEVNLILQKACKKKQECYVHVDKCNQELFKDYKRVLDDIKLMLKKRIKYLIFEAN